MNNLQDRADVIALMGEHLSVEDCENLLSAEWWNLFTDTESAYLQFNQDKLCMPFREFHRRAEVLLSRPIYTHEFTANLAAHINRPETL